MSSRSEKTQQEASALSLASFVEYAYPAIRDGIAEQIEQ
jgi:hypothetical protein